ncbi:serine protease inhibitor ecotin [Shewanella gaetbuli]|uniref:Serine protease inhibitor ecotin n=1 Tax=Shewanella gaetbuli TaxID=220752 RepID=A0A9X1ZK71_9GAMM|nr:serine protease inhibitor ecotin [Shewanella gaetbuli]MCL1142497.1 serine protease inhibitor ecotin [Shewanella gaetbuli]
MNKSSTFYISIMTLLLSSNAMATSPVHHEALNSNAISTKVFTTQNYQSATETKMYPKPSEGMTQHIITLPKRENEQDYLLEVQIGKTQLVDCNQHRLMGKLEQLTVEGWGYPYYQVEKVIDGPSTMKMCIEPKQSKFVPLGEGIKVQYDSRLPKVFYLPQDVQIRYRLWKTHSDYLFTSE